MTLSSLSATCIWSVPINEVLGVRTAKVVWILKKYQAALMTLYKGINKTYFASQTIPILLTLPTCTPGVGVYTWVILRNAAVRLKTVKEEENESKMFFSWEFLENSHKWDMKLTRRHKYISPGDIYHRTINYHSIQATLMLLSRSVQNLNSLNYFWRSKVSSHKSLRKYPQLTSLNSKPPKKANWHCQTQTLRWTYTKILSYWISNQSGN